MKSEQEMLDDYRKRIEEDRAEQLANNSILIKDFISYCSEKGIRLTKDNFDYVKTIGLVAKYPNIVELLNDDIQLDKEGLIGEEVLKKTFSNKKSVSGFYYSDRFMVMAHPYFRRGHHDETGFAPRFVDQFWHYSRPNIQKYVAIDSNRVRINVDNSFYMELDTWYGAKFQKEISDIEDGISKLRPPLDLAPSTIDFIFNNTYSLDIKWSSKNDIRVFQAEDFKVEKKKIIKDGNEFHPARYVHAEYDTKNGMFRHFDGAIHFYTSEEYYQRREGDFNYNEKSKSKLKPLSQKLFKINGNIEVKDWIELSSQYFTGNSLIFEYFEGALPDRILEMVEVLRNSEKYNNAS